MTSTHRHRVPQSAWHEHDDEGFTGCARFFRPGYAANLVQSWLPTLDGMVHHSFHEARR